jgi:NAD(P)-dependent dehydrogenase (short-subunit alcohol dehydrogenase family)
MSDEHRRVAVVTGAARGGSIGRATAARLLADGFDVLISDIPSAIASHPDYEIASPSELEQACTELADLGNVKAVACDVRDSGQVEAMMDVAIEHFGQLDVLVNNAGVSVGVMPIVDLDLEDWKLSLDVMATGVFLCSRAAARRMVERGHAGRIITIASQSSKTGMPLLGAYTAAKWAALGFTQCLAHELGPHGITVNAVCPGTVDTHMLALRGGVFEAYTRMTGLDLDTYRRKLARQIPLGRFAEPEEVAAAVSFLASEDARYITGESINVTGGQEMH